MAEQCSSVVYNTIYKIDKQQQFPYSTSNYIKYLIITYNGKASKKRRIYILYNYIYNSYKNIYNIYESLCCTPETNTIL